MLSNLTSAGYNVPGFVECPSILLQQERFKNMGFTISLSRTMWDIYRLLLREQPNDIKRIDSIERLDEVEEYDMLMSHYCFTVSGKGCFISLLTSDTYLNLI